MLDEHVCGGRIFPKKILEKLTSDLVKKVFAKQKAFARQSIFPGKRVLLSSTV